MSWILFDEGKDYDQAREWLKEFYNRNLDNPGHALGRILRIAYYFDRYADLRKRTVIHLL